MAAQELGGGMDHDVGAVLDGPDQVGGAESVVDDQRQAVAVGQIGQGVDVGNVGVGVAQGLDVQGLGVVLNGGLHRGKVVDVDEGGLDAVERQGVGQQVIRAAVDGLLGHDMFPGGGQRLDGVGDGRCAGGQSQRCHAALQCCHPLFQHVLRGIGQPSVDVAGIG